MIQIWFHKWMNYTLWPEILSLNALKVDKEITLFRHF